MTSLQIKPLDDSERNTSSIVKLVESAVDKSQNYRDEISVLKTRILELEQTADTDPLVPVYNRRALMREIGRAQTLMSRYDILCSIIFFDLNGFKKINDQYGHSAGDDLLIKVGAILSASVRDCDMVARIGGDEFGVLLFKSEEMVARAKAASLACRIASQYVGVLGEKISISAAWGVSACHPEDTARQILHRADRAMYDSKPDRE
ncbi:MAG: GGDEF domain-containing protein [Robiginitomaculum sp.]|nr:GGDEF domain-containing protein [Robiginitomaculum sp.]